MTEIVHWDLKLGKSDVVGTCMAKIKDATEGDLIILTDGSKQEGQAGLS